MKGLLLKDWYLTVKCCKSFFLVEFVFVAFGLLQKETSFFLFYPCLFGGMLPMALMGYEEREGWGRYGGTLPVTRGQLVGAKYLTALFSGGFALAMVSLAAGVQQAALGSFAAGDFFLLVLMVAALSLVGPALLLPCIFKLGVEKGRLAYYLVIGGGAGIGFSLTKSGRVSLGGPGMSLLLFLAAAALYAASWALSVKFYQRREL